jgi:hypothetical protein
MMIRNTSKSSNNKIHTRVQKSGNIKKQNPKHVAAVTIRRMAGGREP